jgi:4-amino-4-deoxy-L-arabinose transferase-like glycosyltransferase
MFEILVSQSLATKGRDFEGHFLPPFFFSKVHGDWFWPVQPYVTAGFLQVLPFSEWSARLPMALAAVLNVVLVFLIGRRLFDRAHLAFVPALLLAMTPPHVILNRYSLDSGLPATFALAWLLAMLTYMRTGKPRTLFVAGVMLALGFYSYIGAVLIMPLYLALSCVVLWRRRDRPAHTLTLVAGFVIPIAGCLPWLLGHWDMVRQNFTVYQGDAFAKADLATAVSAFGALRRVSQVAQVYIHFWDPSFLFVTGTPTTLMHSTFRAGVIVVGVIVAARRAWSDPRMLLLLGAFLLAPLPSSIVDFTDHLTMHAIWRAVSIMPMGALLAGLGVERLLAGADTVMTRTAWCLALAVPLCIVFVYRDTVPHAWVIVGGLLVATAVVIVGVMGRRDRLIAGALITVAVVTVMTFADFYADYMTDYQARFAATQTDGDWRVLEEAIARAPVMESSPQRPAPAIYLGFRLGAGDWGMYYWLFYLHKHHREDLLLRTINDVDASTFSNDRICRLPSESLVVTRQGWDPKTDSLIDQMTKQGELTLDVLLPGDPPYWLLRTTGACSSLNAE